MSLLSQATTVARRLRIDVHDDDDDNNNDNAWQRGPLWPHGMGPMRRNCLMKVQLEKRPLNGGCCCITTVPTVTVTVTYDCRCHDLQLQTLILAATSMMPILLVCGAFISFSLAANSVGKLVATSCGDATDPDDGDTTYIKTSTLVQQRLSMWTWDDKQSPWSREITNHRKIFVSLDILPVTSKVSITGSYPCLINYGNPTTRGKEASFVDSPVPA